MQLPPLRERKDDIPLLVQHFLEKYGEENHKTHLDLTAEALDLLQEYDWPGNVRELENVIERAVVLSTGARIDADLDSRSRAQQPALPDAAVRRSARRHFVQGSDHRLREAPDRVDARGRRRRAEARRGAAPHQADDAERDDQAARHPSAPQARDASEASAPDLPDVEDIDEGDEVGAVNRD